MNKKLFLPLLICLVFLFSIISVSYSTSITEETGITAKSTGSPVDKNTDSKSTEKKDETKKTEEVKEQKPPQSVIQIGMEVLNISKVDFNTGKYSAELGILVQYPEIDLPLDVDYDEFESTILEKLKDKELRDEVLKYYEENDKTYSYVLKDGLSDEEKSELYQIIKSTGYYDTLLPFEINNGKIEKDDKNDKKKIERIELDPEDPTLIYYKINAEINMKLDFRSFPFDTQDLSILLDSNYLLEDIKFEYLEDMPLIPESIKTGVFEIEVLNKLNPSDREEIVKLYVQNPEKTNYELKDDYTKEDAKKIDKIFNSVGFNTLISPSAKVAGWVIKDETPVVGIDSYMKEKYSTFKLPITIIRNPLNSIFKIMVPLILIVLISFLSLFIGTSVLGNRLAILSGILLACVMFHINCTSSLPQSGIYLNLADKLFIVSYASIFINVLMTVLLINHNEKKNTKAYEQTSNLAKIIVPLFTILGYILVLARAF